jgi:hypothetical protein
MWLNSICRPVRGFCGHGVFSQRFHHPRMRKAGVFWGPRFRAGLRFCRPSGTSGRALLEP